jgi:3-oxoacyl-[acyl-carrier protein] reductase
MRMPTTHNAFISGAGCNIGRAIAPDGGDLHDPRRADRMARVPLGRQGAGEEIAAVCGMLCSEEGSYVSGQMIAVSRGGVT